MSLSDDHYKASRRHSVTCVPRHDRVIDHVTGLDQSESCEAGVVEESRVDPVDLNLLAERREESLVPLKEDLADWLSKLLHIEISADNFMSVLDNGVHVCELAQLVHRKISDWRRENKSDEMMPRKAPRCRSARSKSWFARDNVANFLSWCREFNIRDDCLFETEGLVLHHSPRSVVLCLLEIARLGARYGLDPLPSLITMEREIDLELEHGLENLSPLEENLSRLEENLSPMDDLCPDDSVFDESSDEAIADVDVTDDVVSEFSDDVSLDGLDPLMTSSSGSEILTVSQTSNKNSAPCTPKNKVQRIKPHKLPNTPLNDEVMKRVKKCQCPDCYDVTRVAEGKYVIGGRTVFVRLLNARHVMVRVGGGWDTLDHYLEKHDPCRAYKVVNGRSTRVSSAAAISDARRKTSLRSDVTRPYSANPEFLVFSSRYKAS